MIEQEIWRTIPPEEKFEMMAMAQANGVTASIIMIVISATIAIGLQIGWFIWAAVLASPFVFQFAAGKKWRDVKPRRMLEYLAARSAARRFAFSTKARDLTLRLLFRGKLEEVFENDFMQEALEAIIDNTKDAEVWVALFGDAVVMLEERPGGGSLRFGHLLDDKLQITGMSPEGKGDYSNDKELTLTVTTREKQIKKFKLTSRYPAALVVFEKRALALKEGLPAIIDPVVNLVPEEENETFVFGES